MTSRLALATSPYLRQHASNPVEWFEWGQEAFDAANALGRPIFLSIGYSSCHWCHVMAHESFEDAEVARLLNEHFVSIKVDREERPDIDDTYMMAVQLASGRGGWPMSVFLTPDLKPFFTGTYFPKDDRGEYPGFISMLENISEAWESRRDDVQHSANEFAEALKEAFTQQVEDPGSFEVGDLKSFCLRALEGSFDANQGGFDKAPKFPPHTAIAFLFDLLERDLLEAEEVPFVKHMVRQTLLKMCLGGIHDQVGGGFHRYSTDGEWLLPHFEKMLYDNALMLGNLARAKTLFANDDDGIGTYFEEVADRLVTWLEHDMLTSDGLFGSALDADSEGEEGKYYTWTQRSLQPVLGNDADAFFLAYNFHSAGNFFDEATGLRTGANIPHLSSFQSRDLSVLDRVLAERDKRVAPEFDYKAVVEWNGLLIGPLIAAGRFDLAKSVAETVLQFTHTHGSLPRTISNGVASGEGFLSDYAAFAIGLFRLAEVDAKGSWKEQGQKLTTQMIEKFFSLSGFNSTAESHQFLFGRSQPVFDSPTPSGNALAVECLILSGREELAAEVLTKHKGWMVKAPHATEALYSCFVALGEPEKEVKVELADDRSEIRFEIPEHWYLQSVSIAIDGGEERSIAEGKLKGSVSVPVALPLAVTEMVVAWQACTEQVCLPTQRKTFAL